MYNLIESHRHPDSESDIITRWETEPQLADYLGLRTEQPCQTLDKFGVKDIYDGWVEQVPVE